MPSHGKFEDLCSFISNKINARQLITLLEKLGVVIFVKDLDGKYTVCNDSLENVWKLRRENVCGRSDHEMPWAESAESLIQIDKEVINTHECLVYEKKFDHMVPQQSFIVSKAPLYNLNHEVIGILASCINITELRNQQEELSKVIEQKDRLIDVCGHEIRGPIHSGALITQNLIDEWKILTEEEKLERIKIVWAANKKVELIAENLFGASSSRHNTLKLKIKKSNVKEIIQREINLFENAGLLYNNKAALIVPEGESFETYCDPIYISQVIANLLSNAAKFTDNGLITIKLQKLQDGNISLFQVDVIDTGVGIPQDQVKNIFNFAEQSSKTKGHYYGLGIGLSLCKEIVTKHGGKIWADNNKNGKGAIVSFVIPHKNVELENAFAATISNNLDRKLKIVVIDDDVLIHKVFKLVLNKSNFEIIQLVDGHQAIEYLKQNADSVDVIFLDYSLRDLSGDDIIKALQEDPKTTHLINRIVVQTGFNIIRDDIRSIRKPYTYEDVIGLVADVLNQSNKK